MKFLVTMTKSGKCKSIVSYRMHNNEKTFILALINENNYQLSHPSCKFSQFIRHNRFEFAHRDTGTCYHAHAHTQTHTQRERIRARICTDFVVITKSTDGTLACDWCECVTWYICHTTHIRLLESGIALDMTLVV